MHITPTRMQDALKKKCPGALIKYVPANCTSKLQPCDVGVQKPFKGALRAAAAAKFGDLLQRAANDGIAPADVKFDLRTKAMKPMVCQFIYAGWKHLRDNRDIVTNAWAASGLDAAWDVNTQLSAYQLYGEGKLFPAPVSKRQAQATAAADASGMSGVEPDNTLEPVPEQGEPTPCKFVLHDEPDCTDNAVLRQLLDIHEEKQHAFEQLTAEEVAARREAAAARHNPEIPGLEEAAAAEEGDGGRVAKRRAKKKSKAGKEAVAGARAKAGGKAGAKAGGKAGAKAGGKAGAKAGKGAGPSGQGGKKRAREESESEESEWEGDSCDSDSSDSDVEMEVVPSDSEDEGQGGAGEEAVQALADAIKAANERAGRVEQMRAMTLQKRAQLYQLQAAQ